MWFAINYRCYKMRYYSFSLLMILLGQCLEALRQSTASDSINEENSENLVVWYLLILSHAIRSGEI